jgi:hypothetical protein
VVAGSSLVSLREEKREEEEDKNEMAEEGRREDDRVGQVEGVSLCIDFSHKDKNLQRHNPFDVL